ncbi:DUF1523 family protein (plasmid) [Paracoccus sp. TK19116]|uniref:DUF1523 family protein n=1 Tax=Paracoccus albicereus TaxID=2922394 RepID=A0ABT1MKT7_9RHOB|nr:DUF1523 family protein [Paracoccus albicereus]MCQ0968897.1 DUF1523 family protein [Paracoccus albicereus]
MYYVKAVLGILLGLIVFMFLDYSLPSKNTVRITNTYNRLTYISPTNSIFYASDDTGTVENQQGQRDIRFIDTVRANGKVFVYRNEDTGWIWPPYFKYDSSNLHSEATNLKSTASDPQWVSITAYGWRVPFLSIYPNAISIDTVAGPAERPRNWAASIVLVVLFALLVLFWRMWAQFRQRTIQPAAARADRAWDGVEGRAGAARGRVTGWMDNWRGKPRR